MTRLLGRTLVVMFAALIGVGCTPDRSRQPPNVLIYLIDALRSDHLGAYGHDRETSPFIDRLASQGVLFENCYAQAPWTKPSMAAILTSRLPSDAGVVGLTDSLRPDVRTLAEVLTDAGYYAAGFSANPIMGSMGDYSRGFDEFVESNEILEWPNMLTASTGSSRALNRAVESFLDRHAGAPFTRGTQPLFLYVHAIEVHEEYEPDMEFLAMFAQPERYAAHRAARAKLLEQRNQAPGWPDLHLTLSHFETADVGPARFIEYAERLYDAEILAVDRALEALLGMLSARGLLENTLVIVTSDHGEEFLEHGGTSHGFSLYDEILRIPLVVWWRGRVPEGLRVRTPVRSIDLFPTVLDLAGLSPEPGIAGRSLVSLIRGYSTTATRQILAERQEPEPEDLILRGRGSAVAIVDLPWKFIWNRAPSTQRAFPIEELYRLDVDPGEETNLIDREPEVAARLRALVAGRGAIRQEPSDAVPSVDPEVLERLKQLGYGKRGG